jgi:hypothetical protein
MANRPIKPLQDEYRGLDLIEGARAAASVRPGAAATPFLQVWFRCANVYQRVHRSPDGSGYRAVCGKCGKAMNFVVGPGGTSKRVFEVSC